jgi:hypothetical protein
VGTHYHRFKRVPLVFRGKDAVSLLAPPISVSSSLSNVEMAETSLAAAAVNLASSREHAVFFLQHMIDAGCLVCVVGDGTFQDNASLYRFNP